MVDLFKKKGKATNTPSSSTSEEKTSEATTETNDATATENATEELENEFSKAMYNNCMANNFFRDISEFFDVVRHGNASELKRWGYTDEEIIKFFVLPATAPDKTEYANMYWNINTLSRYDSVVQNIYQGDNFTIPMPKGEKPIKISNGMKILKKQFILFSLKKE